MSPPPVLAVIRVHVGPQSRWWVGASGVLLGMCLALFAVPESLGGALASLSHGVRTQVPLPQGGPGDLFRNLVNVRLQGLHGCYLLAVPHLSALTSSLSLCHMRCHFLNQKFHMACRFQDTSEGLFCAVLGHFAAELRSS